jgi:hypothetical protein
MKKLKVADFLFEDFDVATEFCCALTVFYTFSNGNIDELEMDELTYFNIIIGTPRGLGLYFEKIVNNSSSELVFFPHIAIIENFNKERIKQIVKEKLENIWGKNEKEVIRKAMIEFDWEYQDDDVELNKLYS